MVIRHKPSLIAAAIQAFYQRDPIDLRVSMGNVVYVVQLDYIHTQWKIALKFRMGFRHYRTMNKILPRYVLYRVVKISDFLILTHFIKICERIINLNSCFTLSPNIDSLNTRVKTKSWYWYGNALYVFRNMACQSNSPDPEDNYF